MTPRTNTNKSEDHFSDEPFQYTTPRDAETVALVCPALACEARLGTPGFAHPRSHEETPRTSDTRFSELEADENENGCRLMMATVQAIGTNESKVASSSFNRAGFANCSRRQDRGASSQSKTEGVRSHKDAESPTKLNAAGSICALTSIVHA